ncbi:MAG: hypothetical protein GY722_07215 [bacterium]|nr:hypothetical protein [bacterium]
MRDQETGEWLDPCSIATNILRKGVAARLNRDSEVSLLALVELHLTEELPNIDSFEGIFHADERGIWYYDGDGSIDDPVWRQRLIPWEYVKTLTLHQES